MSLVQHSKFQSRSLWFSRLWLGALILAPLVPLGCGGGSDGDGGSSAHNPGALNLTTSSDTSATASALVTSSKTATPTPTKAATKTPTPKPTPTKTPKPTAKPTATPKPTPQILRVACVGDSITKGLGTSDMTECSYPAVLQKMLGRYYLVQNFGNGGATALNDGAHPYQAQQNYQDALAFRANIVVIELGVNDSGRVFPLSSASFLHDYAQLITSFRRYNPGVRIYACIPTTSYPAISDREIALRQFIVPLIQRAARSNHGQTIDLFTPLQNQPLLFPDNTHPNDQGAFIIARAVAKALRQKTETE